MKLTSLETELRKVVNGFLKDKLEPHLHPGGERLNRIESLAREAPAEASGVVLARLEKLKSWGQAGRQFFPQVLKSLD